MHRIRIDFRSWTTSLWLAATLALVWPAPEARAFPDEPYSLDEASDGERTSKLHLWGEIAFFAGKFRPDDQQDGSDIIAISPLFGGRIQFAQNWILELQWGFVNATIKRTEKQRSFRVGNPYAAFHYQGSNETLSYRIGLGLTAPIATLPADLADNQAAGAAYQYARAMRGMWHPWLWEPYALAIVVPARIESAKPSGFLWGVELDVGAMITFKTNDNPPIVIGMAGEVGYQALDRLRVGSRFSLVILPKRGVPGSSISEKTQVAVEPYLRFGAENSFFTVRMLINVDKPYGFGFDKNKIWALRFGGGGAF